MLEQSENRRFYLKLFAVALVIFGARLWLIHNFGSPVPFWDQWDAEAAGIFRRWFNNTWTFSDFFAAHNEHRIFFTRILSLLLLVLNERQWDPLLGMVVNALLFSLTAVILIIMLNNLLGKAVQNVMLLTVALLWSVPYAWENTLASFQSQFYMMLLFSLIALWGLLHNNLSLKWWIGVVFALSACFTVASGFFIILPLIVLKLYLIVIDAGKRVSHLPTLLVGLIITTGSVILILLILVNVPHHSVLRAGNLNEFMQAFGKALAWPWITPPWISLVLYLPFLALVFRTLWLRRKPSQAELFVLALGGWVILQAASMAYARGVGGMAPASRYMDILALGVIVNLLAFYFMAQSWYGLPNRIKPYLNTSACLWIGLVILGLGELAVMDSWHAIQNRGLHYEKQLKNTREFIRTGHLSVLQNKPFLHIPYPSAERLAQLLAHPQLRAILPHSLVVPPLLQSQQDNSTFVANGFFSTTGKYQNETTLGSYNHLGDRAVGRFESTQIKLERRFMEIPVAGYLGEKGLTLQLVVEGQPEPIIITPPKLAKESWVSCYVRTPLQPFKLVAIDNRSDRLGWFAFAMPRSLGTLSFITRWLLEKGWMLLLIGLLGLGMLFCSPVFITSEVDNK
ncbi:MAG: hypothetical protein DRR08_24265 [Candidatus Parabeggiatoa sp. nov. 2]|nr:MAG: hypothetical protein DRR08_24265 [Gammaproteobacteria bacterium]